MGVGMCAGESNVFREFLLSQYNVDAYKRIHSTACRFKVAGRTLCSAVDFSQTEHLRRFAHFRSWVVHPPSSQAQQRVKLRKVVQSTYKAGQQCKEGINWTEYKDEPFDLSSFVEYVAKAPAMQSAASAQPGTRVQQQNLAAQPLQPIASNGSSAQPRGACFSSQEHNGCQQSENVLLNGQHAGRLSAGMQSGVPQQLLQHVQHLRADSAMRGIGGMNRRCLVETTVDACVTTASVKLGGEMGKFW